MLWHVGKRGYHHGNMSICHFNKKFFLVPFDKLYINQDNFPGCIAAFKNLNHQSLIQDTGRQNMTEQQHIKLSGRPAACLTADDESIIKYRNCL